MKEDQDGCTVGVLGHEDIEAVALVGHVNVGPVVDVAPALIVLCQQRWSAKQQREKKAMDEVLHGISLLD